jgi:hypothetical protein
VRRQIGWLAVLFLIAHLVSLPPTLEDLDSINFALGIRDFDVARHQPHPPGYPVFVALAKASSGLLRLVGVPAPEVHGLAVLSAVAGAVLVCLLFALYRGLSGDSVTAWWAMAIAVTSPLFWFTALRPLSDMTGLALVVAAQMLLVSALRTGPAQEATPDEGETPPLHLGGQLMRLLAGAALTGFAAGVRVQTVMLSAPLLIAVLFWPGSGWRMGDRAKAVGAAAVGALAWAVPLLIASGGPSGYLTALGSQAGEDFTGVVMLWTHRQPRVAVNAALYSFVWPWGSIALGVAVMSLAAIGLVRVAMRGPRMLALLLVAFLPYAVFHLLFHETITVRYALPLVLPAALLAAFGASVAGRLGLAVTAVSLAVAGLFVTLPAAREYARSGSPSFRAFHAIDRDGNASGSHSGSRPNVVGMHAVMHRVEEWERDNHGAPALRARHGREWLALVDYWRKEPDGTVRFVADPRRSDLVLLDPQTRTLDAAERWSLPGMPFVAGTRPGDADLYTMRPPGWMLGPGWALTAEVGGVTARDGLGPHIQPSVAWVRARAEPAALMIGGRHLGTPGEPSVRLTLTADSGPIGEWEARPGYFLWQLPLPAGTLLGSGYVPLRVSAAAADGSGRQVRVSLEQFDLQSDGVVMFGFGDGWYEPEYSLATGRSWRWMSERARLWVRPIGRDLRLSVAGESPLRYFERAPKIRVLAAGIELARFSPSSDFTQQIAVPAKALTLAGGLLTFESDLRFSPAERGDSPDPRHLALRVYGVTVK